jgi:starch phosphorylase
VGADNFFLFGLTAEEVTRTLAQGYRPYDVYNGNPELKSIIDLISGGLFSHGDPNAFRPLVDHLLWHDNYLLLADYASYIACQERISEAFRDIRHWTRMSILNVARIGKFSSDRAIGEYCREIWRVDPTPVVL